jgi:hypothetical protein
VTLDAKNIRLVELAKFLSKFSHDEVLVPVDRLDEELTVRLPNVLFRDAVDRIGLVMRDRPYT